MTKHILPLLALLLCSCSSISQTKNPATSYAATEVYREKDGSLQVIGDWDMAYASTTTALPIMVATGLKARVAKGGGAYACYLIIGKYDAQASAMTPTTEDIVSSVRELPYSRATLDHAARGAGLTVPLPEWHTRQTFSAAYVRGFLQKADETLRNPATAKVVQTSLPWQYNR